RFGRCEPRGCATSWYAERSDEAMAWIVASARSFCCCRTRWQGSKEQVPRSDSIWMFLDCRWWSTIPGLKLRVTGCWRIFCGRCERRESIAIFEILQSARVEILRGANYAAPGMTRCGCGSAGAGAIGDGTFRSGQGRQDAIGVAKVEQHAQRNFSGHFLGLQV